MPHARSPLFILIVAAYLVAGTLYAWLTPPWQAPDEPAHYNYLHYLASQPDFPELVSSCYNQPYLDLLTSRRFPADLPIASICYEFHQPPLYYLLGSPFFIITGGSLLLLRWLSMAVLGGGVVILTFLIARAIFPDKLALIYGAMALAAFTPMHLTMLASVNNDALAELILAAILLFLTLRVLHNDPAQQDRYFHSDLRLGVLLGLGLVTKTTVYITVPLVAVVLWWTSTDAAGGRSWRKLVWQAVVIYGLTLLIALPWYIRNATLYGGFDILGLARHNQIVVGQIRTADYIARVGWWAYLGDFVATTFRSFWGQFGWMAVPMDSRVYLALTLFTLTALGGLLAWRRNPAAQANLSTGQRRAMGLLGLTVGLMALGYGWYNLTFVQFQGRYFFPALIPLGIFFAVGLNEAWSLRWRWWLVGGLGAALFWVTLTSALQGDLDRLSMVLIGLALALAAGRAWLARLQTVPASWFIAACYVGLAGLALISPFWFIVPYL